MSGAVWWQMVQWSVMTDREICNLLLLKQCLGTKLIRAG